MQLVTTGDGTHTLYSEQYNEHYHSTFGAMTESVHVFINAGMGYMRGVKELTIMEIGFGTGLNALLACIEALKGNIILTYHAIEKYPVDEAVAQQLNFCNFFPDPSECSDIFVNLHRAPWNGWSDIHPCFRLHKILGDVVLFQPDFSYDLIFYDAFAPGSQPEVWTVDIFDRLYKNLNPGGILTTYCVKGSVKRMLRSSGFRVNKLPGPPGKREMLRAVKESS